MAEKTTIARPYAKAVFELAQESGKLQEWSQALRFAALVAADPQMEALIGSPRVEKERIAALFIEIGGERFDEGIRNLIGVLAQNRRLSLLPEIARLYEQHRAEAEGMLEVRLISAAPLSDEQRERFASALEARLKRKIDLRCEIDESILSGAVIRAGDFVIDGSVRGRLERLAAALGR